MSLVDLTTKGLTAHLQKVVLDIIVEQQMNLFEATLRQHLQEHIKGITLGHIEHVKRVVDFGEELLVRIDVNMQEGAAV